MAIGRRRSFIPASSVIGILAGTGRAGGWCRAVITYPLVERHVVDQTGRSDQHRGSKSGKVERRDGHVVDLEARASSIARARSRRGSRAPVAARGRAGARSAERADVAARQRQAVRVADGREDTHLELERPGRRSAAREHGHLLRVLPTEVDASRRTIGNSLVQIGRDAPEVAPAGAAPSRIEPSSATSTHVSKPGGYISSRTGAKTRSTPASALADVAHLVTRVVLEVVGSPNWAGLTKRLITTVEHSARALRR